MILHSLLLLSVLAGSAPSVSAKGFGDVFNSIEDIGKNVSKNKKDLATVEEAAGDSGSGIGKALKSVGVEGRAAERIGKTASFGNRTKKAVASAEDLTPSQERQIGRVASAEIMAKYPPLEDEDLNGYVQTVGQAVAMTSDRPQTYSGYHFQVLNSEEINAISIPGGFIFVTRGMLRLLKNEDQLACVLAHEVAHVALGHGTAAIVKARRMKAGLGVAADVKNTFGKGSSKQVELLKGDVKAFMEILNRTGYGHDKEFDADAKGALYAQRTGYDPAAMSDVLRKIEASSAAQGGFLKTHPTAGKRARKVDEQELDPPAWYRASKVREERFTSYLSALNH